MPIETCCVIRLHYTKRACTNYYCRIHWCLNISSPQWRLMNHSILTAPANQNLFKIVRQLGVPFKFNWGESGCDNLNKLPFMLITKLLYSISNYNQFNIFQFLLCFGESNQNRPIEPKFNRTGKSFLPSLVTTSNTHTHTQTLKQTSSSSIYIDRHSEMSFHYLSFN